MSNIKKFLANLWRWKCGLPEKDLFQKKCDDILRVFKCNWSPAFEEYMRKYNNIEFPDSEWSDMFIKLMHNRLAIGYFRYGPLNEQPKGLYDNIDSIRQRVKLYKETGNDEILVDISNIAMVEYVNGNHKDKHMYAYPGTIYTSSLSFSEHSHIVCKTYNANGNDMWLVYLAIKCMNEFVYGTHPKKHFKSIDDGIHTKEKI